jgi:hypothetical protein
MIISLSGGARGQFLSRSEILVVPDTVKRTDRGPLLDPLTATQPFRRRNYYPVQDVPG